MARILAYRSQKTGRLVGYKTSQPVLELPKSIRALSSRAFSGKPLNEAERKRLRKYVDSGKYLL